MSRDELLKAIKRELAKQVWSRRGDTMIVEHRYHSLFMRNPEPMWIYDVKTLQVLEVNEAALGRYGYARDEFLRLTIKDLRPAEDIPKFLELIPDTPPFDRSGPWRHRLRDNSIIQVLITSHAVVFGDHKARLVMAELADESELDIE